MRSRLGRACATNTQTPQLAFIPRRLKHDDMITHIQLTREEIPGLIPPPGLPGVGAWTEFRGLVRDVEDGRDIVALEFEACAGMAEKEMERLLQALAARHPILAATIIHRTGEVPVGEAAIYVGIASAHQADGMACLAAFMDGLKRDVPVWQCRARAASGPTEGARA